MLSKVDIPKHSGPSSRAPCQASEDRPRLSVEVPGREGRSLWREKEGDRKEAKKSERVIEVLEKSY